MTPCRKPTSRAPRPAAGSWGTCLDRGRTSDQHRQRGAGGGGAAGLEATAACLALERRTWRDEDHITHVRLVRPGEAYDVVARFAPQPVPRGDA